MAEEGVRILPRLPDRPIVRGNVLGVAVYSLSRVLPIAALAIAALSAASCAPGNAPPVVPATAARTPDNPKPADTAPIDQYVVGSGDTLSVFVYRNPDLSEASVSVRPDGRI